MKTWFAAALCTIAVACTSGELAQAPTSRPDATVTGDPTVTPSPALSPVPESAPSTDPITPREDLEQPSPAPSPQAPPGTTPSPEETPVPTAVPATPAPAPAPDEPGEPDRSPVPEPEPPVQTMFGPVECSGSGRIDFEYFPQDPETIASIRPMGDMSGSHVTPVDHIYITHDRADEPGHGYIIRMPADGTVVTVGRMPNPDRPDYRIVIAHTCTLFTTFIHTGEPTPELMAKVGQLELGESWYGAHFIEAGEKLSDASTNTFDFMVHDADVTLPGFADPDSYIREPWKIHTLDPFDFYEEPLRSEVLAFNPRTVEPVGGKIDYDIDGRLIGNWFVEGTGGYAGDGRNNYWETHLAIAYDYIDGSTVIVSIGADFGIPADACPVCAGAYGIKGNAPDPVTIGIADGLIKYELIGRIRPEKGAPMFNNESDSIGTLLAQMMSDRSVRIEVVPGRTPDSVDGFSAAALTYTR